MKIKKVNKKRIIQEKELGITLIALIITIIILIIIISVSISAVTGANGLFGKDEEAVEKTRIAAIQEQAELIKGAWMIDKGVSNGNLNKLELAQVIADDTNFFNGWVDNNDGTVTDAEGKYTITINDKLEIVVNKQDITETNDIEIIARVQENDTNSRVLKLSIQGEIEGLMLSVTAGGNPIEPLPDEEYSYLVTGNREYIITATKNGKRTTKKVDFNSGEYARFRIQDEEKFSKTTTASYVSKDATPVTVPLPEGFYAPLDSSSSINKVENGLVITDAVDEDGYSIGNEFVWVPVSKENFNTEFLRHDFGNQNISDVNFINTQPTDSKYYEPTPDNTSGTTSTTATEVTNMYNSVQENGGFYIARYEAGSVSNSTVSKRGVSVYNNIKWGNSMSDETGGAVELAREMYTGHSTLCYGVQWDAVMRWIYNDTSLRGYLTDTVGKSGYSSGRYDYRLKNIYDMSRNAMEWTMECWYTNQRVGRGGVRTSYGGGCVMAGRYGNNVTDSYYCGGFRIALFV